MTITNVSQTSTFDGIAFGPNADGVYVIGGTNDLLYGGDMSGDYAGMGITLTGGSASDSHFALAVYADDDGTAIPSGWVSTGFFSYVNYAAQAAGSAFGLTGQIHLGAEFTACDNLGGIYGLAECDSAETVNGHVYGGMFGVSLSAGTYGSSYVLAGAQVSAKQAGATTNGTVAGIHFLSGTGCGMDVAMYFGTGFNVDTTGGGFDLTATVGDAALGHVKVKLGTTLGYINVYSDIS